MKLRHAAALALIPLAMGACRKRPPATAPGTDTTTAGSTTGAGARADSIRLEEEARQRAEANRAEADRADRDRRERESALAPVREALTEIIFFEYDSDEIRGEAEAKLRAKADILRANPSIRLRIEGHADQRGSTEYNLALGQRRAEAVRAWLGAYGIDASRFTTLSYGKERPLDEGADESALARNRRAEFAIVGGQLTSAPGGGR
ncbi:MAG TPA: OmpA family protein [Longimicrobium sp.]|jgi:peptidoglycan-associated lipoprotein